MRLHAAQPFTELRSTAEPLLDEARVISESLGGSPLARAAIDERAPQAKRLARDEALAELVRRFFTSHGPATVRDFAWWSGLTVADTKAGLAMLGSQVAQETIGGQTYWFSASMPAVAEAPMNGHLLPVYDEYGIAYKNHSAVLDPKYAELIQGGFFTSAFALKGEIIGMWRRTFKGKTVVVESLPFRSFSPGESEVFAAAAQRFGAFLGMPVMLA